MEIPHHEIKLLLNSSGYKGSDIDKVIPDFFTDRDTIVGLVHIPAHNGPDSWVLNIIIGYALVKVSDSFISELAKDLYKWSKSKLTKLFNKKPNSDGAILLEFDDIKISCYEYYVGKDKLLEFPNEISRLIKAVDREKSKTWLAKFDEDKQVWQLEAD